MPFIYSSLGVFYMCIQKILFIYHSIGAFYVCFNNKFQIAPVVVISGKTCSVSVNNLDTGWATYEYITLPSLSSTIV